MIIREITVKDKQAFNGVAGHPLQAYEWGEFRKLTGIKVVRRGIFEREKLKSSIQVTIHPLPKIGWNIGYFPKGSMPDERQLEVLRDIGKKNRCLLVKLEPNIGSVVREIGVEVQAWKTIDEFLRQRDCKKGRSLFTKYTFQLDLKKKEEILLKKMHPKTRYNVRLAKRKGVKVVVDNSDECFELFVKLLFQETLPRQGFYAHTPDYYRQLWSMLKPAGMAHLLRAYEGKETLAIFMCFIFNKKLYYPYGASTRKNRELMAPNLLMWEMIRFGKKQGCELFDMWGALGPKASSKDNWYGFHRFKQGYGGKLVEFIGTYDLVLEPKLYPVYRITDGLRWGYLKGRAGVKRMPGQMMMTGKRVESRAKKLMSDLIGAFE